jgi:hypothetical protein
VRNDLLGERKQALVDDQQAVAGVRGDPRDLIGVEPQVKRVEDCAGRRNAEVDLQVLDRVPAQRRDAVATTDAVGAESQAERTGAAAHVAIGRAVQRAVRPPGHDLLVGVQRLGAAHDRVDGQLVVHGEPEHQSILGCKPNACKVSRAFRRTPTFKE